jgi:hypothetical protein
VTSTSGRAVRAPLDLGVQGGTKGDLISFVRTENSNPGPGANEGAFATTLWSSVRAAGPGETDDELRHLIQVLGR